jgi:hypothetical protein
MHCIPPRAAWLGRIRRLRGAGEARSKDGGGRVGVFVVRRENAKDGTARFHVRWQKGRYHRQVHLGAFRTRKEALARKAWAEMEVAAGRTPT